MGWGEYFYRIGESVTAVINGQEKEVIIKKREIRLDEIGMPVAYYEDEEGNKFDDTNITR